MSMGEQILSLIDKRMDLLNTVDIGTVIAVYDGETCVDVKLKHKIGDAETIIKRVPIAYPKFGDSEIVIMPVIGAVVLVAYTKYERSRQLNDDSITAVNPLLKHAIGNAIVIGSPFKNGEAAPSGLTTGEIQIQHKSGTYLKFCANGDIETNAPHLRFV
ncbi:MAG: hypothetical protein LUQ71_10225 [Methanoregula sp.]|nr:hypothetical protein [Methanoregula sp.]